MCAVFLSCRYIIVLCEFSSSNSISPTPPRRARSRAPVVLAITYSVLAFLHSLLLSLSLLSHTPALFSPSPPSSSSILSAAANGIDLRLPLPLLGLTRSGTRIITLQSDLFRTTSFPSFSRCATFCISASFVASLFFLFFLIIIDLASLSFLPVLSLLVRSTAIAFSRDTPH